MIPTDRFFDGQSEVEYEGKLYSRIHPIIQTPGKYNLHFKFISTNSEYEPVSYTHLDVYKRQDLRTYISIKGKSP